MIDYALTPFREVVRSTIEAGVLAWLGSNKGQASIIPYFLLLTSNPTVAGQRRTSLALRFQALVPECQVTVEQVLQED